MASAEKQSPQLQTHKEPKMIREYLDKVLEHIKSEFESVIHLCESKFSGSQTNDNSMHVSQATAEAQNVLTNAMSKVPLKSYADDPKEQKAALDKDAYPDKEKETETSTL